MEASITGGGSDAAGVTVDLGQRIPQGSDALETGLMPERLTKEHVQSGCLIPQADWVVPCADRLAYVATPDRRGFTLTVTSPTGQSSVFVYPQHHRL